MKKSRRIYLLFISLGLIFPMARSVSAQHPILSSFTVLQDGAYLRLNWTIKQGQTCNGTFIERAGDDGQFKLIGDIPGVCGDISSPTSYSYVDSFPDFNALNRYRLELGFQGYSDTISIQHSPLVGISHLVYPSPATSYVTIVFENPEGEEAIIELFDSGGRLIFSERTDSGSSHVFIGDAIRGLVFYRIRIDGKELVGKLIAK